MKIRLEEEQDYKAVEALTREAFWNVYRPGCVEHLILHNLRTDPCFVPELDYVLEDDQRQIVANIAYAKGSLVSEDGRAKDLLLIGPVSVLPAHQQKGYGTQLLNFTLERAKQLGYPAVVLTGSPVYYNRFGFVPAAEYGIYYTGTDNKEPFPFFMVKVFDEQEVKQLQGIYADPACYFVEDAEVTEFDKQFTPRRKEVKPGQLTEN